MYFTEGRTRKVGCHLERARPAGEGKRVWSSVTTKVEGANQQTKGSVRSGRVPREEEFHRWSRSSSEDT